MQTHSSHAQDLFTPGTSRPRRSRRTFLLQMAESMQRNVETGQRVAQLRKIRRKTQPVVAGEVGVALRTYQTWEAGEVTISWEKLDVLAEVLDTSPEYLLYGEDVPLDQAHAGTQLDRIEESLTVLHATLAALSAQVAELTRGSRATGGTGRRPRRAASNEPQNPPVRP